MPARVLLKTYLDLRFLRLVTSFAEDAALAFGLAAPEARKLTLACEEIFAYLCGAGQGLSHCISGPGRPQALCPPRDGPLSGPPVHGIFSPAGQGCRYGGQR